MQRVVGATCLTLFALSTSISPVCAGSKEKATHIILEHPSREMPLRCIHVAKGVNTQASSTPKATRFEVAPGDVHLTVKNVNTILYDVDIKGEKSKLFTLDAFLDLTKAKKEAEVAKIMDTPPPFIDAIYKFRVAARAFRQDGVVAHRALSEVALNAESYAFRSRCGCGDKPATTTISHQTLADYMKAESTRSIELPINSQPSPPVDLRNTALGLFEKDDLGDLEQAGKRRFARAGADFEAVLLAFSKLGKPTDSDTLLMQDVTREFAALAADSLALFERYKEAGKLYRLMQTSTFNVEDDQVIDADSGDTVKYTVKLSPRAKKVVSNSPELTEITRELSVRAVGGWEIDAAPGFFVAFGGARDRSYGKKTKNGVTRVVRKGAEDEFKPTAGALVHIHRRLADANSLHWGPSFGLAIEDGKRVQYLAGLSLLFGDKKRVVLTGGLAGTLVDRLDGLNEGDKFTGDKVPLKDKFGIGPFLGLTYNF